MLGLWEVGTAPLRMKLHLAFAVELPRLLEPPRATLRALPPMSLWCFNDPDSHHLDNDRLLTRAARP
jgi:hypothetical protein